MDSRYRRSPDGISIIIVGAGISGLAAAIAAGQKGHKVTVLESKPALNEFGASIGILPNGVKVLKGWGLTEKFKPVVVESDAFEVMKGTDGRVLGRITMNRSDFSKIQYGAETWNIHRADYQEVLAVAAQEYSAKIIFNANVQTVDVDRCCVTLEDGRELSADLIVGADGLRSAVRRSIPAVSHVEPKKHREQAFRCTVPKSTMLGNPHLDPLLKTSDELCYTEAGKYVLLWRLPDNWHYDMVCCIHGECTVPPGQWGVKGDPAVLREIYADFCPAVREMLQRIEGCVNWQLAELDPLSTCMSDSGRVILMGDAWHAQIPHCAGGGVSAIEDAAVLGECLDWAHQHGLDVTRATEAYQTLRKPRVERLQAAAHEGYGFLGASGEAAVMRDKMLAHQMVLDEAEEALPQEERRSKPLPPADMRAPFPSAPFLQWYYGFDAIEDTKKYLGGLETN